MHRLAWRFGFKKPNSNGSFHHILNMSVVKLKK